MSRKNSDCNIGIPRMGKAIKPECNRTICLLWEGSNCRPLLRPLSSRCSCRQSYMQISHPITAWGLRREVWSEASNTLVSRMLQSEFFRLEFLGFEFHHLSGLKIVLIEFLKLQFFNWIFVISIVLFEFLNLDILDMNFFFIEINSHFNFRVEFKTNIFGGLYFNINYSMTFNIQNIVTDLLP